MTVYRHESRTDSPACGRADGARGRRPRRADRSPRWPRPGSRRRRRRAGRGAEDRLQGRGPHRRSRHRRAVGRRPIALAAEVDKDPRLVEVDPVGIAPRRALAAEPDDRRAPARLRHGQCRHRPVECRAGRRRASACCCCRVDPDASAEALRAKLRQRFGVRIGGHHQRQLRPAWRRGTVGIAIGAAGLPALIDLRGQPDLFGRTLEVTDHRLCRRDRRRRLAGAGPGRRGAAGRAGARPRLVGAGCAGRRAGAPAGGGSVPMTVRCCAVGRGRRRQAGARPQPRPAARRAAGRRQHRRRFRASRPVASRPISTRCSTRWPGLANPELGWGRRDETWTFMEALDALGGETWFRLGDGDLATHVERTRRLRAGESCRRSPTISAAASASRRALLPMSDDPVRTRVAHRRRAGSTSRIISCGCAASRWCASSPSHGAATARPQPDFLAALADPQLRAVVICPSNPFISIDPILAVPGVRDALARLRARRWSRCRRSSAARRSRGRPRR